MRMDTCATCRGAVELRFRFCPHCAAPLRAKLVELFLGHDDVPDSAGRMLRVSRYPHSDVGEQIRVSIWNDDGCETAISLDRAEADRAGTFLGRLPTPSPVAVLRRLARR